MKSNSFYLATLFLALNFSACQHNPNQEPTEGEQEGGAKAYFESTRSAALGTNWAQITLENTERATQARLFQTKRRAAFADGNLQGDWYERGSSNVAGSMVATYFYPATEEIYALSSSGTLYKGGLTGGAWAILNEAHNFNSAILAVVPNGSGKRILTAKSDKKIYFSDDEGVSWTQSSGITSVSANGGGKKIIVFNNGVLFYLARTSSSIYVLYQSTNSGATWSAVQSFTTRSDNRVVMWSPFGSDELYLLDNGSTLYHLAGTATTLSSIASITALPVGASMSLSGYKDASGMTLYVLTNALTLYKSTDAGSNWTNIRDLSPNAWSVGIAANPWVANTLYYGEVEFFRSSDGGVSFTKQNTWTNYYGNIDKLHADVMTITPYQKSDGTSFMLIGNHGGIHYFNPLDNSTSNITKTELRNAEYYDSGTISNVILAGSQDQGHQRFGGGLGNNILTATQLTSGDFVRVNISGNGTKYWTQYPLIGSTSGTVYFYDSPLVSGGRIETGRIYGQSGVNVQGWAVPTCNWGIPSENTILVGGGRISSSLTGSRLIKFADNGTSAIIRTEYAYDFLENGGSYITALDHSQADPNYMFVGLNNGKFFYSYDAGTTWTQTAGFTGSGYGGSMCASRTNKNLVFCYGGGSSIFKTTDGGLTFTSMSTNFPNTYVNKLALNTAETLLFAATDAGPYVCVLSTGAWYSLATATTPVKEFRAVEWVASENIARFATYGRGVWDFQVTSQPLPLTYKSFEAKSIDNQSVALTWATEMEQDLSHFEVEKSNDGIHFTTLTTVKAQNKASQYEAIDKTPGFGQPNYYRIKSVELAGKIEWTKIQSVMLSNPLQAVNVYPTFLQKGSLLTIQNNGTERQFYLWDAQGRMVWEQNLSEQTQQCTLPALPSGIYHYTIREHPQKVVKTGNLMLF